MSDIKELAVQVSDLMESYESRIAVIEGEIQALESKKVNLLNQIETISKNIEKLSDQNSELNKKLKGREEDVERRENLIVTKRDVLNEKELYISDAISKLNKEREDFEDKLAEYQGISVKISIRQNEAEELLKECQARTIVLDKAEASLVSRETSAQEKMDKAIQMIVDSKANEAMANEVLEQANAIKQQADADVEFAKKLKESFIAKSEELDAKAKDIESQYADVANRKQELDYQELRINKIIKEKNIETLLAPNT